MRRKKIKIFLIVILFLLMTSVGYAYLSTALKISGVVRGSYSNELQIDKDSDPNITIGDPTFNYWKENNLYKYHFSFNIKNIGKEKYDDYKIIITHSNVISAVDTWNYDYDINEKILNLSNKYILNKNNSFEVSYIVTSSSSNLKILKIKIITNTQTEPEENNNFEIVFTKTGGWGNYVYQYDVKVTNKSGKKIKAWQIDLILPQGTTFNNGWNAIFEENNLLIIKSTDYNGILKNNESTNFGLQLNTNILNYIPDDYTVKTR